MFFGTLGGIPEKDAKGINNDGTAVGGTGFLDPRIEGGDIGHSLFPDEKIFFPNSSNNETCI